MTRIEFTLGIRTPNPLNGSCGTTIGARKKAAALYRKQHDLAHMLTICGASIEGLRTAVSLIHRGRKRPQAYRCLDVPGPWAVHLTRICAGRLDPHDGLRAALKHCADGVATALGVDDGDEAAVTWSYAQEKSARGVVGVRVEIRRRENVSEASHG